MSVLIEASASSDVGRVRVVNEDSYLARDPVFVVADGMGGHARGDKASHEAVRVFEERIATETLPTPDDVVEAVAEANAAVRGLSAVDDSGVAVAGTTLTGVVLVRTDKEEQPYWMVVNVGDSRVYSWDGRSLSQLSVDHSAVQELLDSGAISEDDVVRHPERNVITRALGAGPGVDADIWLIPAEGHQSFVVCSDGLCKEITDDQIAGILASHRDGSAHESTVAENLVAAALSAGGRDNVTVIVVESQMGETAEESDVTIDRVEGQSTFLEDTRPRS